ncbi:hypothetical protein ACFQV4_19505 [Streptomyces thermocarboxydus]
MDTPGKNRWWLVAAAGLAVFIAQLDASVVGVASPPSDRTSTPPPRWSSG